MKNSDENEDPLSKSVGKQRRKDSPGRPLTPLDKILSRHDCISPLETLEEIPEGGSDPIASYLSQFEDKVLIDTEHLAGEGMLSVSYGQNGVSTTAPTDNLTGEEPHSTSTYIHTYMHAGIHAYINTYIQYIRTTVLFCTCMHTRHSELPNHEQSVIFCRVTVHCGTIVCILYDLQIEDTSTIRTPSCIPTWSCSICTSNESRETSAIRTHVHM